MELGLKGKVALVTGASRGIGHACVLSLLSEGVRVAMVSRDPERLEASAAALRAQGHDVCHAAADLADPAATKAAYDNIVGQAGVPDVLICAAGAAKHEAIEDLAESKWRAAWEAKFLAVMNMIDAVRPAMVARGSGVIVPIIGTGGKSAATPHLTGGAANAALMLATVGLARALGPHGIRVVGVNPGATETDRVLEGRRAYAKIYNMSEEELDKMAIASMPLGRRAQPSEVADVAVFLASDRASYMTGTIVQADGGHVTII